jgi:hypothetical protein
LEIHSLSSTLSYGHGVEKAHTHKKCIILWRMLSGKEEGKEEEEEKKKYYVYIAASP